MISWILLQRETSELERPADVIRKTWRFRWIGSKVERIESDGINKAGIAFAIKCIRRLSEFLVTGNRYISQPVHSKYIQGVLEIIDM